MVMARLKDPAKLLKAAPKIGGGWLDDVLDGAANVLNEYVAQPTIDNVNTATSIIDPLTTQIPYLKDINREFITNMPVVGPAVSTASGLSEIGRRLGIGAPDATSVRNLAADTLLPSTPLDIGLTLAPEAKPLAREGMARAAGSSLIDNLLGESRILAGPRANAGLARGAGYDPTQIARDVIKFGPEAGLTGPAGFGDDDLAAMLEASLKARSGAKAGEKTAEELANAAEISQRLNSEAAQSNKVYAEEGSITKRLKKRAQTVGDLLDRMKAEEQPGGTKFGMNIGVPTPGAGGSAGGVMSDLNAVKAAEDSAQGVQKPGSFMAAVGENLRDAAGAPMALKTTISPALLRQGMVRLITSPKAALEETGMSIKAAVREADARSFQEALLRQPWSSPAGSPFAGFTAADVKLKIRDWGSLAKADDRAAEFQGLGDSAVSKALQKLPHVAFSDRQYALEFNAHALNRYGEVAQRMWDAGIREKKAYEDLARVIEHQQHYGSWAQGRMPVFFSTRAMSGRAQAITDLFKHNPASALKPGAAQEAWKGAIAMVGANMAMMAAASQLPGFDIVTRSGIPTLKTPVGTIDPWAGWSTLARAVYDVGTLIEKDLGPGGSIDDLGPDFGDRAVRFLRGQLSPTISKGVDIATGEDFKGDTYKLSKDITSGSIIADMTLPMIVESIVEGYKNYGTPGALAAAGIEGISGNISQFNGREEQTSSRLFGKPYAQLGVLEQAQVHGEMARKGQDVSDKRRTGPYWGAQDEAFERVKAQNEALEGYATYDAFQKDVLGRARKAGANRQQASAVLEKLNKSLGITATRDAIRKVLVAQDPGIVDALQKRYDAEEIDSYPSKELIDVANKARARTQ